MHYSPKKMSKRRPIAERMKKVIVSWRKHPAKQRLYRRCKHVPAT